MPARKKTVLPDITIDYIKSLMAKAAELSACHPTEVTLAQLQAFDDRITEHQLKKFGGITRIRKNFPVTGKDLAEIQEQKDLQSYVNKLEKELGDRQRFEKIFTDAIKNLKPVKVNSYKRPKGSKKTQQRDMVGMLNDTHFGLIVRPEEVAHVNEFNFKIASRRIGMYIDELCEYKKEKRNEVGTCHLLLNGDLIAGVIHGLKDQTQEFLTHQINGSIHILTHAVARLAESYPNVKVYFSTGNHGDAPHRREGHRVLSQIFDSYEGQIFYALSAAHRNTKNVEFVAGHTLFQDFNLPSGRAMFTHGHLLFSKQLGNPGTNVNVRSLSDAIMRWNDGEQVKGQQKVKLMLFGHTHCHFHITTVDGVQVYNAPSLSGVDPYAFSLGINHNIVKQLMFESTEEHIFGDNRLVDVSQADHDSRYDKIIPAYEHELVFKG